MRRAASFCLTFLGSVVGDLGIDKVLELLVEARVPLIVGPAIPPIFRFLYDVVLFPQ